MKLTNHVLKAKYFQQSEVVDFCYRFSQNNLVFAKVEITAFETANFAEEQSLILIGAFDAHEFSANSFLGFIAENQKDTDNAK
jgi:hypothetical protein